MSEFRVVGAVLMALAAGGAHASGRDVGLLTTMAVPGKPVTEFDISTLDPATETYYFSDRSNAGVDAFDAVNNVFLYRVRGFTGYDPKIGTSTAGPNGLALVGNRELWAGNGDSTVKVIDLFTHKIVDSISTGGKLRVDEMAYDPDDHVVVMSNNDDTPPFLSFVSTDPKNRRVLGKISFDDATNGLEASVYDQATGYFYTSVPQLGPNTGNSAVAVVDPRKMKVVAKYPVKDCQPSGITLGAHQELLVGCSINTTMGVPSNTVILNALNGHIRAIIRQVGGSDEVAYDRNDNDFYTAGNANDSGPVLGIISGRTNRFIAALPTATDAHSVAVDPHSNHVFVPLTPGPACANGCIGVYGPIK